jgi:hypothetical protein
LLLLAVLVVSICTGRRAEGVRICRKGDINCSEYSCTGYSAPTNNGSCPTDGTSNSTSCRGTVNCAPGNITVQGYCAEKDGVYARVGSPTGGGAYCWCRAVSPVSGPWVFHSSFNGCPSDCAKNCANSIWIDSTFRRTVLASCDP